MSWISVYNFENVCMHFHSYACVCVHVHSHPSACMHAYVSTLLWVKGLDTESICVLVEDDNASLLISERADMGKPTPLLKAQQPNPLLNWMAPELVRDEEATFSSDVYSFACVVWEMLTGEWWCMHAGLRISLKLNVWLN